MAVGHQRINRNVRHSLTETLSGTAWILQKPVDPSDVLSSAAHPFGSSAIEATKKSSNGSALATQT